MFRAAFLIFLAITLAVLAAIPAAAQSTHPLMPGVRSPEIQNPAWPRTLHDKQLTGFSPLTCGMSEATQPHWFVPLGHGRFGLMKPDPTEGVWHEEVGYDTPPKIGLVDVDGDGSMEVGYALRNSRTFICRDLWTGEIEWELELPQAPNAPP